MGDVINLRMARKSKARSVKEAKAAENRVVFGQTRVEKKLLSEEAGRDSKFLDGHKRTTHKDQPE